MVVSELRDWVNRALGPQVETDSRAAHPGSGDSPMLNLTSMDLARFVRERSPRRGSQRHVNVGCDEPWQRVDIAREE